MAKISMLKRFRLHLQRDYRYLSFANALAITGIFLTVSSMLAYLVIGYTAYAYSVFASIAGVAFLLPGVLALMQSRKKDLFRQGKIKSKEFDSHAKVVPAYIMEERQSYNVPVQREEAECPTPVPSPV